MISAKSLNEDLDHLSRKIGLQPLCPGLFAMLAASPALAQNCSVIGNTITCDDGLSGQRTGSFTQWSDGSSSQRVGNSTLNSDGSSSQRIGNFTYYSDGTSSQRIGNSTTFSDGRTCRRFGNQIMCN